MKTILLALIAAVCTEFILPAGQTPKVRTGEELPSLPGEQAPPLGLESILQAPSDAQVSWKALKGKVVVLEFWATWCGPCVAAIPHLNELAEKFKEEPIQFIAVTSEDEKVVRRFLRNKPLHAWIGLDTNRSMFDSYGATSIPQTVIVDQRGTIAAIMHPTFLTEEHLKDVLAGKKIDFAKHGNDARSRPESVPSTPEPEALFQIIIRPSKGGASSSASNKDSFTARGATVLDILSSSYHINPVRIVPSTGLPEGRYDFIIKTPESGEDNVKTWLRQAVESSFGVTARRETRKMDALVLKAGQLTEHLTPTISTGVSSLSSGGGSLNCVNQSMDSLARSLEEILQKPVINETGLTNGYDFQLLWNENTSQEIAAGELTRALHEQLGLELAPAQKVIELLIVTAPNRVASQSENRVTN